MVELATRFNEEAEADESNPFEIKDGDEQEEWDCESILSTYTNTDNHPGIIKTTRRIRPSQKMRIELHKAFKVPLDGLIPIAEEIIIAKEKKKRQDKLGPYQAAEPDSSSNSDGDDVQAPVSEE